MKNLPSKAALSAALLAGAITSASAADTQAPKPASDAAPMMVIETTTFLPVATGSNTFEIESSKLAREKAGGDDIKDLAAMIIADHEAAAEKLKATLDSKGRSFDPAPPAPKQQRMLDQLKAASGTDFDTLYLDMQAQAHMEAIALFRTYAGSGDDQEVVGFARETLPRLETHMQHVKMLVAKE